MGPLLGGILTAGIPAAISAISGWLGQRSTNRSARSEYDKAREYNTPANQMQRFKDAGLSPWLMYGQGNPGNVSGPRPAQESGAEHAGQGIENYLSNRNFAVDQKNKWMQYWNSQYSNKLLATQEDAARIDRDRKELELWSDFPDYIGEFSKQAATTGYRRKILELKRAASQATVDKMGNMIQNMKYKNMVDAVRAKYAKDYGMVGGDWTQGMGLLKSIPSMFKKGAKAGATKAPWNTTIKTNPILNQRLRRRVPSRGAHP